MAEGFHCDKGPELRALTKEIHDMKKIVLVGNGQKSLTQLVTETRDFVYPLSSKVDIINSNVVQLMKFQNQTEAARQMKEDMRLKRSSRHRWVVGIILTIIIGTGSILAIILS